MQASLFELSEQHAPRAWRCIHRSGLGKGNVYELGDTGFQVHHCGHQTALWPYWILRPDGRAQYAPNGRGFGTLEGAQAHVEAELAGRDPAAAYFRISNSRLNKFKKRRQ